MTISLVPLAVAKIKEQIIVLHNQLPSSGEALTEHWLKE
jgi:hypothetical protein